MNVKVWVIAGCILAARIASAEPVAGFEVVEDGNKLVVSKKLVGAKSLQELAIGDELVTFGGSPVKKASAIDRIVARKKVGDKIPLVIARGAARHKLTIVIEDGERLRKVAAKADEARWKVLTGQGVPTIDTNAPPAIQQRQRLNMKIRELEIEAEEVERERAESP